MNYAYPQLKKETRFLTFGIVAHVLRDFGHVVTDCINSDTDYVLYSLADVTDLRALRRLRLSTKKPIITGGHYSINFWSASNYSDMVWLGEIFDFAKLQRKEDIEKSPHIYQKNKDVKNNLVSSYVDWESIPVVQTKKTSSSYLGGIGCKNNCKFCHTAWTHRHQENSPININKARSIARKSKLHLNIVSNQYEKGVDTTVRDMLGCDYIKTFVKGGCVRIGIEFAKEDTRKKMGKPLGKNDIFSIIQKSKQDGVMLRLFHIGGYEDKQDWEKYILEFGKMLEDVRPNKLVHLQFTNLQYQNFTPLYQERYEINPDNYLTRDDTRRWYDYLRQHARSVLVGPPSKFSHVAWRMGVELSQSLEQSEEWMGIYQKRLNQKKEEAYKMLFETGVLDTPRYVLKRNSGKIKRVSN